MSNTFSEQDFREVLEAEPTLVLAVECGLFPLLVLLDTIAKPLLLPQRCQSYEEQKGRVVEFPTIAENGTLAIVGRQLLDDRYKGW